jgi:hypothetical protein
MSQVSFDAPPRAHAQSPALCRVAGGLAIASVVLLVAGSSPACGVGESASRGAAVVGCSTVRPTPTDREGPQ